MENYKIPPQAIEIEKAFLGALLISSDAIIDVYHLIKKEHFYDNSHQLIYSAIVDLNKSFKNIDVLTVCEELKKTQNIEQVGGEIYVSELTERVATSAHIESHAKIIYEKYVRRKIIESAYYMQVKAYSDEYDLQDVIDFAQKQIMDNTVENIKSDPEHITRIYDRVVEELEKNQNTTEKVGIPSGFKKIRWYKGDLIIFAGRPSMGKTWVGAVKFPLNAAMYDYPVAIFSLEMTKQQLTTRFISQHTGIDSEKIRAGEKNINWNEVENAKNYFDKLPVYIDDSGGLSVFELVSKARKLKAKHGIEMIFVDYMQLLSAKITGLNRDQEIGVISRTLKALAKELDIPVIALSQLSRKVEDRADKRPIMSDLRESGNIEQDADMVLMAYRGYYYTHEADDSGIGEIIIRKNRNGNLGVVNFYHNKAWTRIEADAFDFDKWSEPQQSSEYKPF